MIITSYSRESFAMRTVSFLVLPSVRSVAGLAAATLLFTLLSLPDLHAARNNNDAMREQAVTKTFMIRILSLKVKK